MPAANMPIASMWQDVLACVRFAPAAVLALMLYAALTSSAIFEGSFFATSDYVHNPRFNLPWIPTYFNKFDLVLFGAIAITWLTRPLRLDGRSTLLMLSLLALILISLSNDIYSANFPPVRDALVDWARFAAVYTLMISLHEHLGSRAIENLVVSLFLILALSSLAVYREIFGTSHRIYAAGMTVASSSQIAAVVALIAMVRKRYLLLIVALAYLFLTFSLTSIGILLFLSVVFIAVTTNISFGQKLVLLSLILVALALGIYLTSAVSQFDIEYTSISRKLPGFASEFTFNGRSQIWAYGVQQIVQGAVGVFGIGFGKTAGILNRILFGPNFRTLEVAPHFHSIILEYVIGLGVPSLAIFGLLLRRIGQTLVGACHPAALVFAFFFLSQSLDFSMYHPKEVIFSAVLLSMAEGQWRHRRRADVDSGFAPEPSPGLSVIA